MLKVNAVSDSWNSSRLSNYSDSVGNETYNKISTYNITKEELSNSTVNSTDQYTELTTERIYTTQQSTQQSTGECS